MPPRESTIFSDLGLQSQSDTVFSKGCRQGLRFCFCFKRNVHHFYMEVRCISLPGSKEDSELRRVRAEVKHSWEKAEYSCSLHAKFISSSLLISLIAFWPWKQKSCPGRGTNQSSNIRWKTNKLEAPAPYSHNR